jgi:hypothetical protein
MVTIVPALLLIAWLVPGLILLLAGRFLPAPMVLISVPIAVALTMLAARHLPGRWPILDSKEEATAAKAKSRSWAAWWGMGGTVAIAVAFAAWQLAVSSPQFIVSRDPGAYAQLAYWIADHGVLPIPASLSAFGGAHPGLSFASFGFTSHGTAVVPGLTTGLPIVLAAGMWVHGVSGATVISPLLGALAVLSVGGLTGRLAGPQWAPAGAFLLALTIPEIYTSRSAFSETLAQALLFGGLCLVVDSFSSRRPLTLAVLGGVTLGLTVLAGTGLLLMLLPAIPVAGALLAGRKPQAIPFTAGLVAGVVCGLAAGIGLDFPAVSTTAPSFGIIGVLAAALLVLTAVGVTIGLAAGGGRGPGAGRGDRLGGPPVRAEGSRPGRRVRGRAAAAGEPADRSRTAVCREQPLLGDLVPRGPGAAARGDRPGHGHAPVPARAAHLAGPFRGRPSVGTAGSRHRLGAVRGTLAAGHRS